MWYVACADCKLAARKLRPLACVFFLGQPFMSGELLKKGPQVWKKLSFVSPPLFSFALSPSPALKATQILPVRVRPCSVIAPPEHRTLFLWQKIYSRRSLTYRRC